ncbi:ribosomal-protein-alanine N-acetyltransferase [Aliidongia dinghuensis]|uniref:Ribosomal-protein-alanine N-acetyltransferase n=1 Tax=Aliidongia dinghuensis TaxID=1867774 RepID=A0A8J2YTG2_9PROT|nr:GNAT family protein [Aliidongia dinghuensis]GGF16436.1 ribosomal-protein-alanine N-acetyltransferase [Aliidongia dinghuensis]
MPDVPRLAGFFAVHPPSVRLEGERVMLRPPDRGDWAIWSELRSASRAFLQPWEPAWSDDAVGKAAFRRRLARYALDWRDDEGYAFFVFDSHGDELVGGIGLSNVRRGVAESASLGYWIGERFARQGYMTEALRLMLGFAFDRLHLHRVEAACLPSNAPSRGLLIKSGFREEGYARKYLCIDGLWQDHVLYALLREEWLSNRGGGR